MLSENLKRFIFTHIDSAELLDVLLLMSSDPTKVWSAEKLGVELRTSTSSADLRLKRLVQLGLVEESKEEAQGYFYSPRSKDLADIVDELTESNKLVRHTILQLIFSPLKKGRDIAAGFLVKNKGNQGEENG